MIVEIPDNIKLYGSKKKCQQKRVEFKTKIQLAYEIFDEHIVLERQTLFIGSSGACVVKLWITVKCVIIVGLGC